MNNTTGFWQSASNPETEIGAVFVAGTEGQFLQFQELLRGSGIRLTWIPATQDLTHLILNADVPVVLYDSETAGSDWSSVLQVAQTRRVVPSVIVISQTIDADLWKEVLNNGGFDVLGGFSKRERVIHTITKAYERWSRRKEVSEARLQNLLGMNARLQVPDSLEPDTQLTDTQSPDIDRVTADFYN
jgi:DNA-binding NtrC family response regulator